MMNNMLNNMGADKFMNRLFRKADGVVWDLMTGKVGIKTADGIATLAGQGDEAEIEINMVEQFGMEIPAFAQSTPVDAVAVGDVIFFGANEKPGWVVEKKFAKSAAVPVAASRRKPGATVAEVEADGKFTSFVLMKVDGQRTTWKPPKVSMLGMGDTGVMVLRSLLTMLPGGNAGLQGMQGMLMPMMMMGGGDLDLEKMMPLMLMGQMQAAPVQNADGTVTAAPNPMANMLPMMMMMQMMGNKDGDAKRRPGNSNFFDNR